MRLFSPLVNGLSQNVPLAGWVHFGVVARPGQLRRIQPHKEAWRLTPPAQEHIDVGNNLRDGHLRMIASFMFERP